MHVTLKGNPPGGEAVLEGYARQKGHRDVVIKEITATIEDSFIRQMNLREEETKQAE
jgi:hypothetical protein